MARREQINTTKLYQYRIDDAERAEKAISGIVGKRLTYREPSAEWRVSAL